MFKKSTHSSTNGSCVMVDLDGELVLVKDSKDPDGAVLTFTRAEWVAFIGGVNDGEFDVVR
jgi:Domain of unknown function (DUF397)